MASSYFKGSTVHIEAVFRTASNNIIMPDSVRVYLKYRVGGQDTFVDYAMSASGSGFIYNWDSDAADAGTTVKYWVKGLANDLVAIDGGAFQLRSSPGL